MKRLVGPGVGIIALSWVTIVPLMFLLPHELLFQILNSLIISTALGGFVMFWQGLWDLLKWRPVYWTGGDVWIVGNQAITAGLVIVFTAAWYYRALGVPMSAGHPIEAFGRWALISGLIANLIASAATRSSIPSKAYVRAGFFVAVGVGAALIMASFGRP